MFKTFSLLLFLFLSACTHGKVITLSEIVLKSDPSPSVKSGKVKVSVPEYNQVIVPGTFINYNFNQADTISELAVIEFRKILFQSGEYEVYSSPEVSNHNYTVKVKCTEFVPDTSSLDGQKTIPTTQAASVLTIIGSNIATAAPVLGPLAGFIGAFGPFTGIGLGKEVKELNSMLTLDVQLINQSGEILLSKPYTAGFNIKVIKRGSIISSNSKAVASSSAQEAIIAALEEAFKDLRSQIH